MTDQHPITPPPELVQEWIGEFFGCKVSGELTDSECFIATRAAQWGADQELEATDAWIRTNLKGMLRPANRIADDIRAARRPKPPSLKEQALETLETLIHGDSTGLDVGVIRRALEALPDD